MRAALYTAALVLTTAACQQDSAAIALDAAQVCAPSGWSAGRFPPSEGAKDVGIGPRGNSGQIRLLTPESVSSGKALSSQGAGYTVLEDWWTVTPHVGSRVTFADGRQGDQYRSTTPDTAITTEFSTPTGTWQLYTKSDDRYDQVLQCVETKLSQR